MVKFRKTLIPVLLGCAAAWVPFAVWIDLSYFSSLPNKPDEGTGRVYRMVVNHGYVRYGSEGELRTLRAVENSLPIAAALFLIAVMWGFMSGDFHLREDSQP